MYLLMDLETIPNQSIEPLQFDESTVKIGNFKDPDKIQEKIAKAKKEFENNLVKKMSVTPELCQVVSCAYMIVDENGNKERSNVLYDSKSDENVVSLIKDMLDFGDLVPITWNGKAFDIPVIWKRTLALDSIVSLRLNRYLQLTKKYDTLNHIDLMHVWNNSDYGAMEDCAKFLGIESKIDMDGSMVYGAWINGEHDRIKEYNMQDVDVMYQICKKIGVF